MPIDFDAEAHERELAHIVHQLRMRGWDRLDAIEEADRLMAERYSRRAASQKDQNNASD